jgi:hypothetical protein
MNFNLKTVIKECALYTIETFQSFINPMHVRFKKVWPMINQVEGFLERGQEEWLFKTARSLSDGDRIVEIGGYKGRSTICLAYGCLGTRRHVFTIDKFKGVYQDLDDLPDLQPIFEKGFFDEWKANVEKNGLFKYTTPIVGDSREIASSWSAPIHMLFIDGSHKFEDVIDDFINFYPHVVSNGIIALHDVGPSWEGPYRAWNEHIKHKLRNIGAVLSLAYGRKP